MVINMRKLVFWILGLILAPVLLVFLLGVALYIPAFQRWSVSIIEEKASNALNKICSYWAIKSYISTKLVIRRCERFSMSPRDTMIVWIG